MDFRCLIICLVISITCYSERVLVELSDGSVSRPIEVMPFKHNHSYEQQYGKLKDTPPDDYDLSVGHQSETQDYNDVDPPESHNGENVLGLHSFHNDADINAPYITSSADIKHAYNNELEENHTEIITTETEITESVITLPSQLYQSSTESQPTLKPMATTYEPKPILPCHQNCLDALGSMRLYAKPDLHLSERSNLTLVCELPLNSSFILEDLDWLYHPDNTPAHQCSLTKSEFLPLCHGFHTIKDTDDRNSTFIQDSITLTNVRANHSGQYMCQVKLTCCQNSLEHVMNKEKVVPIIVQIWMTDYTTHLAIAGSITLCLAIVVITGSYYMSRRQMTRYIFITDDTQEIKSSAVLHLPLVDDDNDSFDSNFDAGE